MGSGGGGGGFPKTKGGRANFRIHRGKQEKHIEGTNNYRQQIRSGEHPSILTADPAELLREGAGKGRVYGNKEVVDYGRVIGKCYVPDIDRYLETTRATIHYDSRGGAHIVPADPNGY